jgi:hypothetical protein
MRRMRCLAAGPGPARAEEASYLEVAQQTPLAAGMTQTITRARIARLCGPGRT